MRKKWLSFLLVFCFLVTASSAFGAPSAVPQQLNGTWHVTGIQFNATTVNATYAATALAPVVYNCRAVNSTLNGSMGTTGGGVNATFNTWGTAVAGSGRAAGALGHNDKSWINLDWLGFEDTNPGGIQSFLKLEKTDPETNSTGVGYYFAPNSDYSFLVGLSNNTWDYGALKPGKHFMLGANLAAMYHNATIVTRPLGTWSYYGLATQNNTESPLVQVYMGKLVFANATTGTATLAYEWTNGTTGTVTKPFTYVISDGQIGNVNATDGSLLLFSNGTMTADGNMIVAFNEPIYGGADHKYVSFGVALKDAAKITAGDFKSQSFNLVTFGKDKFAQNSTKALGKLGYFATNNAGRVTNGTILTLGNTTTVPVVNATNIAVTTIDEYTWTVANSRALAGQVHGNASLNLANGTATGASFLGKKKGNVIAGIYSDADCLHVGFLLPQGAQVGGFREHHTNATYNDFAPEADFATGLKRAAFTAKVTNDDSDVSVITMNINELAARFTGVTDNYEMTIPLNTFWHAVGGGSASNVYVTYYTFKGGVEGKTVADLGVLYKFYSNDTAGVSTGNTTRAFTYRGPGTKIRSGMWWITEDVGVGVTPVIYPQTMGLSNAKTYRVNIAIGDNSVYDADARVNFIRDPSGGLGVPGGGVLGDDDDDDEGCVFNPAASMSLEFLLLLLVPVAYLIRRRKK